MVDCKLEILKRKTVFETSQSFILHKCFHLASVPVSPVEPAHTVIVAFYNSSHWG
jgi:hypothetical protein